MESMSDAKENKVFSMLRTFERKDLRFFNRFIQSSYFNKHPQVTGFYQYIISFHPDFADEKLGKKKLFEKFFRGEKYNDKKIRYLFTDLARLLEKYLVNEHLAEHQPAFNLHLLEAHRKRNNLSCFLRLFNDQEKKQERLYRDARLHYHSFMSNEIFLNYIRPTQSRKEESNIEKVMENLDLFYISKKLELSCETENAQALLDKNYKPFLLQELLKKLGSHAYADEADIAAYLGILKIVREPENERSFDRLLKRLMDDEKAFSKVHLAELYQYVLNFCIKKINSGRTDYHQRIFDIYKIILSNGVLYHTGLLSPWDYKNVATVSLRLKNFSWAKSFIHEFRHLLPASEKDNAYNYNMANYYFQKKEFNAALKLLQGVEFSDPVYQLDARAMLLKIYVEQDNHDALFHHFKAFQTFLERNKLVSKFHKTLYGNLIRYTKKMVQAQGNKEMLTHISSELQSITQVADLSWLKTALQHQ
jgi:hypothetical protein